jgi:hypothetical protein
MPGLQIAGRAFSYLGELLKYIHRIFICNILPIEQVILIIFHNDV